MTMKKNDMDRRQCVERILLDTNVPTKYIGTEGLENALEKLISHTNTLESAMMIFETGIEDKDMDGEISVFVIYSAVIVSQALRDIDRYSIKTMDDIITYAGVRKIPSLFKIPHIMEIILATSVGYELDFGMIIGIVGAILTNHLENNGNKAVDVLRGTRKYIETGNIEDLIFNI